MSQSGSVSKHGKHTQKHLVSLRQKRTSYSNNIAKYSARAKNIFELERCTNVNCTKTNKRRNKETNKKEKSHKTTQKKERLKVETLYKKIVTEKKKQ